MTFEQIRCFIAAVEHTTFFNAAESLNLSQSALSKQIIKLEKELDIRLFDRSRRNAVLTEAGREFYRHALTLDSQYGTMRKKMDTFRESCQWNLHVGTLPFLTQYQLTEKLKAFRETHPEICLTLSEVEEHDLMDGLNRETFDLVFARNALADASVHRCYPLAEDELTAVLPADHCLAQKSSVTLTELAGEDFLLMNPYTSIYQQCMELFQKAQITPHILRTGRAETIISAVSVKEGISLLGKSNFEVFSYHDLSLVPLDPPVLLPVSVIRLASHPMTQAMRTFIHAVQKGPHN